MVSLTTNFKVRLIEIPKIKKTAESEEMVEYGKFTLNKKYRVYSIYSAEKFTQFLVADDNGIFNWINTGVFRK